ncbi:MAG TPA: PA14 domain-containing protein,virulence plasmid 28 protein [Blastocatellia bacterium]|nr:PA14 domain-containing protein,virulence plasmid 28 protein [Blastocatellia bacterium]
MSKKDKSTYVINGRVIESTSRQGIPGLRVEAWDKDLLFDDLVGSAVTDVGGHFRIEFSGAYYRELFFDREPDLFFRVFSGKRLIKSTEDSVMWNVAAGSVPVEIPVAAPGHGDPGFTTGGDDQMYQVSGSVISQASPGVGGLRVEVIDKNIGHDVTLNQTSTDENGKYQTSFPASAFRSAGKVRPDLQARVYADQVFLAASDVRYNASNNETQLNVTLPADSKDLASEYETLSAAVALYYKGPLADLKEDDNRQDITYLANKSGWDARAVALLALSDQFSQRSAAAGTPLIKPAFYYALFRAGLPANEDTLYQADIQAVERIWRQAIKQRVIPNMSNAEIIVARESFHQLSSQKLLSGPTLAGASSLKEILAISQIAEPQQQEFAQLYTAHRTDLPRFWSAVNEKFGEATANRLQVNGKLAFLTVNNAPLINQLHRTAGQDGLNDPAELAAQGYHRAEKWNAVLSPDISVPKEIPGDTVEAKRTNYANYLAAQVRISYPTAAVAQMVQSGDLPTSSSEQVHRFLSDNQGKFEIGITPVQKYIVSNNLEVPEQTVNEVKRLQRVYQITSDDVAMTGLLKRGMDAAYHVVSHDRETFVRSFSEDLGGATNAAQTYDQSVHVHNAVLNLAVSYLTARNSIALGAPALTQGEEGSVGNGIVIQPLLGNPDAVAAGDVIAYPTLEKLFGEMDFCACEHCRSILSPAAYLVDLLLFIDQPHPASGANPQTVLLERRPDIQHLPLTCENTNTALPYIDVVNETLEYFIANGVRPLSLDAYVGHDTDGLTSEDLLATPQFVMDSAYNTLRNTSFPSPLPFHQPLESVRRYFDSFEVSLPLAMERLRKNNALDRGTNAYGWRDILMEAIGISRAEHEILIDSTIVPLWRMYGFPDGTADAPVIAGVPNFTGLSKAKAFTRHVGITYQELTSILRTRFVNPNSDLVPKLERLGVSFAALKNLKDTNTPAADAEFDAMLQVGAGAPDPAEYDGNIKAWVRNQQNFDRIMAIITLSDPTGNNDPCSFENLEFRYARPVAVGDTSNRLGAVEFVRILRLIRLWKKLGWTIEQTDTALCALFPVPPFPAGGNAIDTVPKLDTGFFALLPRLGIVIRVMKALKLTVKRDLLSLLTCWSPIGTHGDAALFRQMFLNPTLLNQDPAFADSGYGEFFKDATQKILGHAETLRAAFGLTSDEFLQIVAAVGLGADKVQVLYTHTQPTLSQEILNVGPGIGYDNVNHQLSYTGALSVSIRENLKVIAGVSQQFKDAVDALYTANQATLAPLTLDHISNIYRRGWLARKLKISVREFLLFTQLTGLDPFATPNPTDPAILKIIELIQSLKEGSFKTAAALYLIWNQDLTGKSAPELAQITAFARALRGDLAAVDADFVVKDDPDGAISQNRMTLVYGPDTAAFFFGLLSGTFTVDIAFNDPDGTLAPEATLTAIQNASGKTDAGAPRLAYDDFRKLLSYAGALTPTKRDAIKLAAGLGAAAFKTAMDDLFLKNEAAVNRFFARYPELQAVHDTYVASTDPLDKKRTAVLTQILPDLIKRRKRQQALQSVSVAAETDFNFAETLLDTSRYGNAIHAIGHDDQPAVNDILALEIQGLSTQFFASDTAIGTIISAPAVTANLDYAPAVSGGNPLPSNPTPGSAISGIWRGYLEAPESGFFNLLIDADAGATVKLKLDNQQAALTQNGTVWHNTEAKELRAGTLYAIELTVEKVRQVVKVQWEWSPKGQGRAVIPRRYLYPANLFDAFRQNYLRFLKASDLATTLRLRANEMAHFATHEDYRINALGQLNTTGQGWLNHLPTEDNLHLSDPAAAAVAATLNATLLTPLRDLLKYARMKSAISPDDESLLYVIEDPTSAAREPDILMFTLTRWDRPSLDSLLLLFGGDLSGLKHLELFNRVYEAFELAQKMGISVKALIRATTNEPNGETVRDLQAALRARYDAADWRTVVQPINDKMRSLQRDALVAYILNQMSSNPATAQIDTPNKLFEYFLMDVEMEPCMQTSRIRHALSSVQLFIERCLLNLEPRVSSGSIIAKQWDWMKRYRVWEANRKVFLYPENWLEPELRDDKSPFFKEIESELLQSDITDETASVALLNYLAKLEEVAKLEPCGIHHIPAGDRTSEVDHVVARTSGAHRKYYYRRRDDGSWTPWEQIKLDIEDNPVLPVVWRGRLFLFWLRLIKKGPATGALPGGTDLSDLTLPSSPKINVLAILNWSEYFNGKWQPVRTSDTDHPLTIAADIDEKDFDRAALQLSAMFWTRGELRLIISTSIGTGNSYFLHNVYSSPELRVEKKNKHFAPKRILETSSSSLKANYTEASLAHSILDTSIDDRAIEPHHPLEGNPWDAPFFYEDRRHVFFVTTEEHLQNVRIWNDLGIVSGPLYTSTTVTELPPLVWQTGTIIPDFGGPITRQPGFGVVDPAPAQFLVTEDAYITRGIGSPGTVRYGDKEIGPMGSNSKALRRG